MMASKFLTFLLLLFLTTMKSQPSSSSPAVPFVAEVVDDDDNESLRNSSIPTETSLTSPPPPRNVSRRRHHRSHEEVTGIAQGSFYTMHQVETHAVLEIRADGKIKWDHGAPTLYSKSGNLWLILIHVFIQRKG